MLDPFPVGSSGANGNGRGRRGARAYGRDPVAAVAAVGDVRGADLRERRRPPGAGHRGGVVAYAPSQRRGHSPAAPAHTPTMSCRAFGPADPGATSSSSSVRPPGIVIEGETTRVPADRVPRDRRPRANAACPGTANDRQTGAATASRSRTACRSRRDPAKRAAAVAVANRSVARRASLRLPRRRRATASSHAAQPAQSRHPLAWSSARAAAKRSTAPSRSSSRNASWPR